MHQSVKRQINFLHFMSLIEGIIESSVFLTALPFLNRLHYTTISDVTFFIFTRGLNTFSAAISSILISVIATYYGPRRVLTLSYAIFSATMLLYLLSDISRHVYAVGTVVFSLTWTVQIVRLSLIAGIVPVNEATVTATVHQTIMTVGYLVGPMVWYGVQTWRGRISLSCFGYLVVFDRFSLLYLFNAVVSGLVAVMSVFAFRHATHTERAVSNTTVLSITEDQQQENAQQSTPLLLKHRKNTPIHHDDDSPSTLFTITLFSVMAFLFGSSTSIVRTSFQTLIVNTFHFCDSTLGLITFIEAIVMTSVGAFLSKLSHIVTDNILFIIITFMQLFGMALFLPLFGSNNNNNNNHVSFAQVMLGVVCSLSAGISFAAVCVNLISKRLGTRYEQRHFGVVWCGGMLGMACSNWILGTLIVEFIGSWMYVLFMIPIVIVLVLFLSFVGVGPMTSGMKRRRRTHMLPAHHVK